MKAIIKRDGRVVAFDENKIALAIEKAFAASGETVVSKEEMTEICTGYAQSIVFVVDRKYNDPVFIEDIQNEVETLLMETHPQTAKKYILYREDRHRSRDKQSRLMKTLDDIARSDAKNSDLKRENANIDGNTAMGTMLKFGSESAKAYYKTHVLPSRTRTAHEEGDIHIHDLDFLTLTTTCCQIDLTTLYKGGFSTGHGYLREPNSIQSYSALAAIALQANQNDQHGGQSIPNFDRDMAPGVLKTYRKVFKSRLIDALEDLCDTACSFDGENPLDLFVSDLIKYLFGKHEFGLDAHEAFDQELAASLWDKLNCGETGEGMPELAIKRAHIRAMKETEAATHQAMEAFIHNLNTMHSRAGAQVPFSSINYGTDTSPEGRMVIRNVLLATLEGLGRSETPIFPIQIFRMKRGINFDPGEPNYDLFLLACKVSAKRLFPNFSFQDAPYNLQHYKPGDPRTEIAYMGCRTRVIGNVHDKDQEISYSRGNLSFTTINLPRLAINAKAAAPTDCFEHFYGLLDEKLELVAEQLLERFAIQSSKKVRNFPFLMGQGIWLGSDKLGEDDTVGEVLKHGTLSIGFIGLAEALTMLTGSHHGDNEEAQQIGLAIVKHMRDYCDRKSEETMLNFTLLATPAEGLSGRFVKIDMEKYGLIAGVTDKKYYTNSFHIPVGFEISAYDKIRLEAPYHALTNAGHITYIELDGDVSNNIEAFTALIRYMAEAGAGYGAINHPVDRDPVCGYSGVIHNECPGCGRDEGDGKQNFERIRRITGYLVGTVERFNDAKRQEERDRVKHVGNTKEHYERL